MNAEYEDDGNMMQERIDAVKEAHRFFSKAGKSGKEKSEKEEWPVTCFLSHLQIPFDSGELVVEPGEPVDVTFRDARFQNKEIIDGGRKRTDEYREAVQKAERAASTRDLLEYYTPIKIAVAQVGERVVAETTKLNEKKKYAPSECMRLDLLFYFNLQGVHVVGDAVPEKAMQSDQLRKWRSVSVFSSDFAYVLFASESAPDFLRSAMGTIHRNCRDWLKRLGID